MKKKHNLAWHFVGKTLSGGLPIPPNGVWLHTGECIMYGRKPINALMLDSAGDTLCLVEVDGIEEELSDVLVCRRRKIIERMDATDMLRYFARMWAIACLDYCRYDPPQILLEWLWTGDEKIRDKARIAAWMAAEGTVEAWWIAWAPIQDAYKAARGAVRAGRFLLIGGKSLAPTVEEDFNHLVYECFEGVM